MKISEATPDTNVTGVELVPVSDAGSPKSVSIAVIKQFVIDQVEALSAGTAIATGNGLFALQTGVMKPIDIDLVCQRAINTLWGKAAKPSPAGTDIIPIKDGATEKTATLANVAAYVKSVVDASTFNLSLRDPSAALTGGDILLVTQGTAGKKTTITAVSAVIYAALKTYISALTEVTTPADSDAFYVIQGGNERKVPLSKLKAVLGSTVAPGVTIENYIPQWSSAQKTLKNGLLVSSTIRSVASSSDNSVSTEKAVALAIAGSVTRTDGDASGVVVQRFGASATEGLETVVVDKVVTLGAVEGAAVFTVPSGAVLRAVQANVCVSAVAGGTTTTVGLGVSIDPDAYGVSASLSKNAKVNMLLSPVRLAAAVDIAAFPCAGDGSIGDTLFSAGTLRVRIVFDRLTSLDNAV